MCMVAVVVVLAVMLVVVLSLFGDDDVVGRGCALGGVVGVAYVIVVTGVVGSVLIKNAT